jgi:hypothetical protein
MLHHLHGVQMYQKRHGLAQPVNLQPAHRCQTDLEELAGELEGGRLEVDPAWGVGEHEAEVDVDDVALLVQQDVPVVPVLHLPRAIRNCCEHEAHRQSRQSRQSRQTPQNAGLATDKVRVSREEPLLRPPAKGPAAAFQSSLWGAHCSASTPVRGAYLQEVAQDRVARHALHEVPLQKPAEQVRTREEGTGVRAGLEDQLARLLKEAQFLRASFRLKAGNAGSPTY